MSTLSVGSSLASRLARLPAAPGARQPVERPAQQGLAALIPPTPTGLGPLYLLEAAAEQARTLEASSLQALALSDTGFDASRPLYFDTETTGLAGGTGTLAFLLGIAETRGTQLVVSQAHLPGPGCERPLLRWFAERVEASTLLVSFNGKSFDWPLLKSRYVMNRLPPPPARPHLDLLHCARRVFRHHLSELKLSTLEQRVLDVHRDDDIPGAQIPSAWFDYLRTGRVAVLARVLAHNERDVRSMVELVHRLAAAWEERTALLPETALGLATVAARRGDQARALRFCEQAARGAVAAQALSLRAELRRRQGEYGDAVATLHRALEHGDGAPELHLRLAKLYEHRLRDFTAAQRHATLGAGAEAQVSQAARQARLARRTQAVSVPVAPRQARAVRCKGCGNVNEPCPREPGVRHA